MIELLCSERLSLYHTTKFYLFTKQHIFKMGQIESTCRGQKHDAKIEICIGEWVKADNK